MRACTLGCDHLFELGYVYVDADGAVRKTNRSTATDAMEAAVALLDGRMCTAHSDGSDQYFAWHRNKVAQ